MHIHSKIYVIIKVFSELQSTAILGSHFCLNYSLLDNHLAPVVITVDRVGKLGGTRPVSIILLSASGGKRDQSCLIIVSTLFR